MNATATKPKSSVVRQRTHKPKYVQSAIVARRMNGDSKSKIARDLGIARNTVTSIVELSDIEQQIAEARQGAIALAPRALTAIDRDLGFPGGGTLGLRLLNDIGAIGEDALESVRRNSQRQSGAINVLVQAGATVTLSGTKPLPIVDADSKRNVLLCEPPTISSKVGNGENNSSIPVDNKDNNDAGAGHDPSLGKQPKRGGGC